jgi:hypothetical protein
MVSLTHFCTAESSSDPHSSPSSVLRSLRSTIESALRAQLHCSGTTELCSAIANRIFVFGGGSPRTSKRRLAAWKSQTTSLSGTFSMPGSVTYTLTNFLLWSHAYREMAPNFGTTGSTSSRLSTGGGGGGALFLILAISAASSARDVGRAARSSRFSRSASTADDAAASPTTMWRSCPFWKVVG